MRVLLSVLAALFGVRSEHQRQRDFERQSPIPFILVGIALISVFVLALVLVVKTVIANH